MIIIFVAEYTDSNNRKKVKFMIGKIINRIKGPVTNKEFISRFIVSTIYSLIATFIIHFIFNRLPDKYRNLKES